MVYYKYYLEPRQLNIVNKFVIFYSNLKAVCYYVDENKLVE